MLTPDNSKSHLKNRILVQGQGGGECQPAGIRKYVEDLKREPIADIGAKDIFEIGSNDIELTERWRARFMRYCANRKTKMHLWRRLLRPPGPPSTLAAALLAVLFLFACTNSSGDFDDEYLIRVSDRVVTVGDFNKAFEISKSIYPHSLPENSILLQEAQIRLLNQMIEELLVLQRAAELQIELTEPEVTKAIAAIKADYPEGVFEQMLLEYAVTYSFWEKRLKIRLMMEKVIAREVRQQITLTPEEIAKFYKENYEGKQVVKDNSAEKTTINELIVKQLRRQKAEETYQLWIINLKEKYTVDINQSQWKRLSGL